MKSNTAANDWDDEFMNELEARSKSIIDGTTKTYSWEETKRAATKKVTAKKK